MTALVLTTRRTPAGPVLAVAGDLDHHSTGRFRAAVEAITLKPGELLTVDLVALTFCDSSGITALIAARNHAHAQGADIGLASVPAPTLRILRFVGLDQILPIHPVAEPDTEPGG